MKKVNQQRFSCHQTVLFASTNKTILRKLEKFAKIFRLKIWVYDDNYTEFIGVPYFVAVIDRTFLETKEWDYIINTYRAEADDKTRLLIIDELDSLKDRYCHHVDKDHVTKIIFHIFWEYIKVKTFNKVNRIRSHRCSSP